MIALVASTACGRTGLGDLEVDVEPDAAPDFVDGRGLADTHVDDTFSVPEVETRPGCSVDHWCVTHVAAKRLNGVWGSSSSDVWVVGDGGVILHFDGAAWSKRDSGTSNDLSAIWGAARDDIWMVGWAGTALHFDGGAIRSFSSGSPWGLFTVWGASSKDVYAAGDSGAYVHWDGVSWTPLDSPNASHRVQALWGTSPHDVWSVSASNEFPAGSGPVLHWDGTEWALSKLFDASRYGVWGSGAGDVWVVGDHNHGGAIDHLASGGWTDVTSPAKRLDAVWGSAAKDVWAVGMGGDIVHYDGAAIAPSASGVTSWLHGVWGESEKDVFAVGDDGTILRRRM